MADAPWGPGVATGISLVRLAQRSGSSAAGSLAWLVTLRPSRPVYVVSQGPDPLGTKGSIKPAPPRHANLFLIVLDARDGWFITAAYGYSRALAGRSSASRARLGLTERQILRIARAEAAASGDRGPTLIQHAEGTRAEATLIISGAGDDGGQASYLIAERGHFTAYSASPPPGIPPPTGSVLTLVIDSHTGDVTDYGLSNRYPNLARLSPVKTDLGRAPRVRGHRAAHRLGRDAALPRRRHSRTSVELVRW